jgi:soluble lytic murein transglycosylase-like protein
MGRSLTVGCWSLLSVLIVFCAVPSAVGSASHTSPPAQDRKPSNAIGTLFSGLSRCGPALPERERWRIAGVIHQESQRYGYDPLFVLAMVQVESGCSPTARGPRGAVGLIQVQPATARAVAEEVGLSWLGAHTLAVPALNVRLGLRYLTQLEKRFHDPRVAVAAYNLGPKRVARMSRRAARGTTYVRKVLAQYEDLLARQWNTQDVTSVRG